MKEKIAEIILSSLPYKYLEDCLQPANKILSLFPSLDGIVVEEECGNCRDGVIGTTQAFDGTGEVSIQCPLCYGTGTITRQAEWWDIDIEKLIYRHKDILGEVQEAMFWISKGAIENTRTWIKQIIRETEDVLTTKSGGRLRVKK